MYFQTKEDYMEEDLNKYLIDNQDCLIFRELQSFVETYANSEVISKFGNITKYILSHPETISELSTDNLIFLHNCITNADLSTIVTELKKRFENGENIFSGKRAEISFFGISSDVNKKVYGSLCTEINLIESLQKDIDNLNSESPDIANFILSKTLRCVPVSSFIGAYQKGLVTSEKLELLSQLLGENPYMYEKVNYEMLQDDYLAVNYQFLTRLFRYQNQQTMLMILHDNNLPLFHALASKINEWEETLSQREAINLEGPVLNNCALYIADMQDATEEDIDEIINFSLRKRNSADLRIRVPYYKGRAEEAFFEACDEGFSNAKSGDEKLKIYAEKYLASNLTNVKRNYERKFRQLKGIAFLDDPEMQEYIAELEYICSVDINDQEQIKDLENRYKSKVKKFSPMFVLEAEEMANQEFLKTFEQPFADTLNAIKNDTDFIYEEFQGVQVRIVNAPENFDMIVRSTDTGFVANKTLDDGSIKLTELQNDYPNVDVKSGTYINQDFLGVATLGNQGTYFVYLNNNLQNMCEIGNSDINSNVADWCAYSSEACCFTQNQITQNSRKVYIEATVFEKQPDAILLFNDATDIQRQNALLAASEYGIDVIYMDKDLLVSRQIKQLENMREKFDETGDLDCLQNLISMYETNVAGWILNRDPDEEDKSKTCSIDHSKYKPQFDIVENEIYKSIAEYCKNQSKFEDGKKNIHKVAEILQGEIKKYQNLKCKSQITSVKMKFNAQGLLEVLNNKYDLGMDIDVTEESKLLEDYFCIGMNLGDIAKDTLDQEMVTQEEINSVKNILMQRDEEKKIDE